uniref:Uncharacterized protein n=1 Tax=Arundo donax TaxID=35708 RepID=A0A0A9HY18_ARUDO
MAVVWALFPIREQMVSSCSLRRVCSYTST